MHPAGAGKLLYWVQTAGGKQYFYFVGSYLSLVPLPGKDALCRFLPASFSDNPYHNINLLKKQSIFKPEIKSEIVHDLFITLIIS